MSTGELCNETLKIHNKNIGGGLMDHSRYPSLEVYCRGFKDHTGNHTGKVCDGTGERLATFEWSNINNNGKTKEKNN